MPAGRYPNPARPHPKHQCRPIGNGRDAPGAGRHSQAPQQTAARRNAPRSEVARCETLVPGVALHRMQWRRSAASSQHEEFGTRRSDRERPRLPRSKPHARPTKKRRTVSGVYRPIWDFQRSALMTFALLPVRALEEQEEHADDEHLFRLDSAALSKALHDLAELSSGRRLPILARIHYGTIVNNRRWGLAALQQPRDCRRQVVLAKGLGQNKVARLVSERRPGIASHAPCRHRTRQ